MAYENSYEFANVIRDLNPQYQQLVASQPMLISAIRVGTPARSTKHEWLEEKLTPTSATISAFDTDGDGTGITVDSTAGFTAGDILRVETSANVSRTEIIRVASVDSATELTVVRDYGGSTGATLATGDILTLVSSPLAESTDASVTKGAGEATANYNYTSIQDAVAKVSKTSQAVGIYGVASALNDQVQRKMLHLARRQNTEAIYGRRVERDASNNGSAGGFLQFMESGNVTNVSGAITSTVVNNAFESIFDDGAFSSNYALVCKENQARKISAFNTTGSNPVMQFQRGDTSTGQYVTTFVSDLGAANGFNARVFVDPNMPSDQVAIIDLNRVSVNYLRTLTDEDATPAGADYFMRRMLMEYTFEIRDGKTAHALLTGLTV